MIKNIDMLISIQIDNKKYTCDLSKPIDISMPLSHGAKGPKCFNAPSVKIEPVRSGSWVGSTKEGGIVNFKNVFLNPHGNGTHTECVGHISTEDVFINTVLKKSISVAQLISVEPRLLDDGDMVIGVNELSDLKINEDIGALIIRTLPNDIDKKNKDYSETNPPYLTVSALQYIVSLGVTHLLLDLPSVDREYDDGKLAGHRAFWNYPETLDLTKTITELIYVDSLIKDGLYLCDIQIINLDMDASPSRPLLYKLSMMDVL